MFEHINRDDAVEMLTRNWKVIFFEYIHGFTQKPGNLIVVFAGDVGPRPFTTVVTEMPVERPIVIAARDEQTFFVGRFAKQFQERRELLLLFDRTPEHFDLPRKVIRLHKLCRYGFHLLERIGLDD